MTQTFRDKDAFQERASLLKAAFALIQQKGWASFHVADLVEAANFSLASVHRHLSCKEDLMKLLHDQVRTAQALEPCHFPPDTSSYEKLFELFMRRFDLMADYREGLREVQRAYVTSPFALIAGLDLLTPGVLEVLETASLSFSAVDRGALTLAYGLLIQTWVHDETPDLSKTMSHLDSLLTQLEEKSFLR